MPPRVANAYHEPDKGNTTYPLGSMIVYKCKDGFEKGNDDRIRAWCVGPGFWVGPMLTCHSEYPQS